MRALGINRPSSDPWLPLSFLSRQLRGGGLWPRQEGSSLAAPSPSQLLETRPPEPPLPESIHLASKPRFPLPLPLEPCFPLTLFGTLWSPCPPPLPREAQLICWHLPCEDFWAPGTPCSGTAPCHFQQVHKSSVLLPCGAQTGLTGVPLEARWLSALGVGPPGRGQAQGAQVQDGGVSRPLANCWGREGPRPPASPAGFLAAGCSWLPRSISSVRAPATPTPPLHSLDCHVRPRPGLPGSLFQTRDTGQC